MNKWVDVERTWSNDQGTLMYSHDYQWDNLSLMHIRLKVIIRTLGLNLDVRYMQCVHVLLFDMRCIVPHRSLFDGWCGILFSYLFSWFLLDVTWNHLWDVLTVMLLRSLCLHVDGILMLSPCMSELRSLWCHVGRMLVIVICEITSLIRVLFEWEFL